MVFLHVTSSLNLSLSHREKTKRSLTVPSPINIPEHQGRTAHIIDQKKEGSVRSDQDITHWAWLDKFLGFSKLT